MFLSLLNAAFALTPQPDATQFQHAMASRVLSSNFQIAAYSYHIEDSAAYSNITKHSHAMGLFVAERVRDICKSQNRSRTNCDHAYQNLVQASFTRLSDTSAVQQFSNWIYALDGDNWYQFENLKNLVDDYLNTTQHELVFFPTFQSEGVLVNDLGAEGQSVIFNHETQSVTIWTLNLRD